MALVLYPERALGADTMHIPFKAFWLGERPDAACLQVYVWQDQARI